MTAIITQVVPIIQLPAICKFQGIRSLVQVRREEVISRVSVVVAAQPAHLVLEALGQAQGQQGIPVIGDHQPKVQLYHTSCSTLVHTQATLTQGDREAGALIVDLQREAAAVRLLCDLSFSPSSPPLRSPALATQGAFLPLSPAELGMWPEVFFPEMCTKTPTPNDVC